MPYFYFHLRDDSEEVVDPDGINMPTVGAARKGALEAARDIMSHTVRAGSIDLSARIDVEDSDGHLVLSLRFLDAVELIGQRGS